MGGGHGAVGLQDREDVCVPAAGRGGAVWLGSAGRVVCAEAGDMSCLLPRALAGVTALKFVGKWFCTWR